MTVQSGRRLSVKYTARDGEGLYGSTISLSSINNSLLSGGPPEQLKARKRVDAVLPLCITMSWQSSRLPRFTPHLCSR